MSEQQLAVVVKNIYKSFRLPHERHSGIKQLIVQFFRRRRGYEVQHVLEDVSFEIKKGEFFGIVGRNGSGKSTLLKLLAGIYAPDKGAVQVNGSLTPFIELGVGFNPELTGRENVYMNGALLGFSRAEMDGMYDEIVEFAELERFMDQKLKNYSSGMQVRLAFSIAIRAKSDVLLIDEVLAVGDAIFQKKCYDYFKHLKKEKRTVVFVSHDLNALQEYCDKGVLVEKGRVVNVGGIEKIVEHYQDILNRSEEEGGEREDSRRNDHSGDGRMLIQETQACASSHLQEKYVFNDNDKDIYIVMRCKAIQDVADPVYGITVFDAEGKRVITTNSLWMKVKAQPVSKGQQNVVTWKIPNIFSSGTYTVTPALASDNGSIVVDRVDGMLSFKVRKQLITNAYTNPAHTIEIKEMGNVQ